MTDQVEITDVVKTDELPGTVGLLPITGGIFLSETAMSYFAPEWRFIGVPVMLVTGPLVLHGLYAAGRDLINLYRRS